MRACGRSGRKISPLVKGEVAALTMATAPLQIPDLAFQDAEGKTRKLSEWKGRTVLVNLWATWCVPCRKEMPALDKLRRRLEDRISRSSRSISIPATREAQGFSEEAGLTKLAYFHDQKAKVFQELKSAGRALGMPTSVLVDGAGCEVGTIAGPAEWASEDAFKLIKAATAK
jgi:thiol-disulfide isomerase/thioredoxin